MNRNTKTTNKKSKKKRDSSQGKKMVGAVIAIIIVITMLISVIEAIFQGNIQNPAAPQISLKNGTSVVSIYNI